jgi:hypothetical protein
VKAQRWGGVHSEGRSKPDIGGPSMVCLRIAGSWPTIRWELAVQKALWEIATSAGNHAIESGPRA